MNDLLMSPNDAVDPDWADHDHRRLIRAMDLAHIEPHSPGQVFWHPKGWKVMRRLEAYARALHEREGYDEVRSPQLLSQALWEQSGHWAKYRAGMFVVESGDGEGARPMALKPMSCPGHIGIFAHHLRSYRDLPMRLFEFGAVHRNEPSGSLSGLLRLRGFVQDDAHVFADPSSLHDVVAGFIRLVEQAYPAFGFNAWRYRLSLRPENRAGSDELWDRSEQALRQACAACNIVPEEAPGEGAFYGPKLEVILEDRLGRSWQCGVIQVDFVLPERFHLSAIGPDGQPHAPVLLHHAVFGSLERWLAIVLEHHGGLPDGLAPEPIRVFPLAESSVEAARQLWQRLRDEGVPAGWDPDGPLPGRLKAAAESHVPLWAVIGPREAAQGSISVRRRGEAKAVVGNMDDWVKDVAAAWRSNHAHQPLPLPQ